MVSTTPVHAESARYHASLAFVPGLWTGPGLWRGAASYLAHRGWEGELVDLRRVPGGLGARAAALAAHGAAGSAPRVFLGHGAGALVALAAARLCRPAAAVLVSPVPPGLPPGLGWRSVPALMFGRPLAPPLRWLDRAGLSERGPGAMTDLGPEPGAAVRDVARGRLWPAAPAGVPTLLVTGSADQLLTPAVAARLAATIGAEREVLAGAGHWLVVGPGWEQLVDVVHRWLVQRLGETLLELYAEAMAERAATEEPGDD